ncbi:MULTISPECIES: hypothetical protein [Pontibacillus]|uniref:Uncharacterized protein n=1 Tax=Pontibacillus chungwhensis TaxID=265426 RepID=A0ABY8V5Z2_9BACI|nr:MULTISPECIES: hypothetical protein [Pontibacillus]MCD5324439.1 hypothetical protein [Pontibacillus sp. HN14]WIF99266.1 hypothetical protein QNI29_06295 [Pontibacillus chungwhensis]
MEKNTEDQILNELKNINHSLQEINEIIDNEESGRKGPSLTDILRSLLTGVFIVGPAIVVVILIFQILGAWIFN